MRFEIVILGLTAFFIFNAYHDGKYTKLLMSYKKYYSMAFFGIVGVSLYLLVKRNPAQSRQLLMNANNVVKYMPFDRSSMDMLSPIMDFTMGRDSNHETFMENFDNNANPLQPSLFDSMNKSPGTKRMLASGKGGTKRSVSETKKKYVASKQNWKCGDCENQLNAWFEVDHKMRLEYGGGNDVDNLVALCRDCHGKKTAMENM